MRERSNALKSLVEAPPAIPHRTAIAAGFAGVLPAALPAPAAATEDAVSELIRLADAKNAAFMRGDMDRWADLTVIAPDFTLMQPLGGPASHGFDKSPKRLAELSEFFRNGEATLEVAQTYSSNELVVLVMIERQHGEVGGLPDQDWSLRVTEVYRKAGAEWQLAHRHADPLARRMTLEQSAMLARGQSF